MKKTVTLFATALFFVTAISTFGREARLVRYPHFHNGRVVFTYLGDIWTADENGQNVQRLTVNRARDVYGRFSPDGKWIAFSSERNGNLDVYVIPSGGGNAKQLTTHSADDVVLGWSNDSRSVLFSGNRGEDFTAQLYLVSIDGGMPWKAGTDMGVQASYSPDGSDSLTTRRRRFTGASFIAVRTRATSWSWTSPRRSLRKSLTSMVSIHGPCGATMVLSTSSAIATAMV